MRMCVLGLSCVLFLGGTLRGLAQSQQTRPRTLEGLLNAADQAQARTTAEPKSPDKTSATPSGKMSRPKDGVKHPDLDKAWTDYGAAVAKAAESIRSSLLKQFDTATAKGDLDAAVKWQTALEHFEQTGDVPTEQEAKAAVNAFVTECRIAKEELAKSYESLVKTLTIEKKLREARAVRDESHGLEKNAAASRDGTSLPDRREEPAVAARELSLTIRLTSDWGSVTLHPASSVEIGKQEVVGGGQQWKVTDNKIALGGPPYRPNDSTVTITCRLKGPARELVLETHKGDIGALYVGAMSRGKVLGQFPNEGSHGGNAQRSDSCRQDFKVVLP